MRDAGMRLEAAVQGGGGMRSKTKTYFVLIINKSIIICQDRTNCTEAREDYVVNKPRCFNTPFARTQVNPSVWFVCVSGGFKIKARLFIDRPKARDNANKHLTAAKMLTNSASDGVARAPP